MSEARGPRDLTRWNRAGLSRFEYVDRRAPGLLEDLRVAMLRRYLREAEPGSPEWLSYDEAQWRQLFADAPETRPDPNDVKAASAWAKLVTSFPDEPETPLMANRRMVEAYDAASSEYAYEIMRAFARAGHVLLGHVGAFANERYLRTASQWENVRRLAATVNYQPTPPGSAVTPVALIVADDALGVEIDRGLGMKTTPPGAPKPLIFETLRALTVHPDLNGARVTGWNTPTDAVAIGSGSVPPSWIWPDDLKLGAGDLVVISSGAAPVAAVVASVTLDPRPGIARVTLAGNPAPVSPRHQVQLHAKPAATLKAKPRDLGNEVIVVSKNAAMFQPDQLIDIGLGQPVRVVRVSGDYLVLSDPPLADALRLRPLVPIRLGGDAFYSAERIAVFQVSDDGEIVELPRSDHESNGRFVAVRHAPAGSGLVAYGNSDSSPSFDGHRLKPLDPVTPSQSDVRKLVAFPGKPPKGLAAGDVFWMKHAGGPTALTVAGVRAGAEDFVVAFVETVPDRVEDAEFHGPMTRHVRPQDHDRNPQSPIAANTLTLRGVSEAARLLLKPERKLILEDERWAAGPGGRAPLLAQVVRAQARGGAVEVVIEPFGDVTGFEAGWTIVRLNTVEASHGETQGRRVLGSGDGERDRQTFRLAVTEVSFPPDASAEAGVSPALDVAVGGVLWSYHDLTDVEAEGKDAWSTALRDDGALDIHFRRRLPTGPDNVVVTRHRVGSGLAGNAAAAYGFKEPNKKHRYVTAIVQPMPAAGGSARESVGDIRVNAPARLAANDRAVSLADFERLVRRHAGVWQARATPDTGAGPGAARIVVVPAGGAALTAALQTSLVQFVEARAPPGARIAMEEFERVPLRLSAQVWIDLSRYVRDEVVAAAEAALAAAFRLEVRPLGEAVYVGQILAALETVEGVESATATFRQAGSAVGDERAVPQADPTLGLRALFPTGNQVAYVVDTTAVEILPQAVTP